MMQRNLTSTIKHLTSNITFFLHDFVVNLASDGWTTTKNQTLR